MGTRTKTVSNALLKEAAKSECIRMIDIIRGELSLLSDDDIHSFNMVNDSYESDKDNYEFTDSDLSTLSSLYNKIVKIDEKSDSKEEEFNMEQAIQFIKDNYDYLDNTRKTGFDNLMKRIESDDDYKFKSYEIDMIKRDRYYVELNRNNNKKSDVNLLNCIMTNKLAGINIREEIMFIEDLYLRYKEDKDNFVLTDKERSLLRNIKSQYFKSSFESVINFEKDSISYLKEFNLERFEKAYNFIQRNRYNGLSPVDKERVDKLYNLIISTDELFNSEVNKFYQFFNIVKPLKVNSLITKYTRMAVSCRFRGLSKDDKERMESLIEERSRFEELLEDDQKWFVETFENNCRYTYTDLDDIYNYIDDNNDSGDLDEQLEEVNDIITANDKKGINVHDYNRIKQIYRNVCIFYKITCILSDDNNYLSAIDRKLLELVNTDFRADLIEYCERAKKNLISFENYLTRLNSFIMYSELVESDFENTDREMVSKVKFVTYNPNADYDKTSLSFLHKSETVSAIYKLIDGKINYGYDITLILDYVLSPMFNISSVMISSIRDCYNKKDVAFWEKFSLAPQTEEDIRKYVIKDTLNNTYKVCISYICSRSQMSEDFIKELSFITSKDVFAMKYYNKTHIDEFNKILRMENADRITYLENLDNPEIDRGFISKMLKCVNNNPPKLTDRVDWVAIFECQESLSAKFRSENSSLYVSSRSTYLTSATE